LIEFIIFCTLRLAMSIIFEVSDTLWTGCLLLL
jgi:hypothetical protein